jgi:xanthine dehydrogenase YagR molybdenum-binding subunit
VTRLIGTEVKRVDGRLKVTGAAEYAAEHDLPGMLHAVLVGSAIAAGKIATLDVSRARALPGVVEIYTHANRPRMGKPPNSTLGGGLRIESPLPLGGTEIRYHDQCVAMVVAETLEEAKHAAMLVDVRYGARRARVELGDPEAKRERPRTANAERLQIKRGKVDRALEAAAVRLDETYETPCEHPSAMELHATIASFQDGTLTVYDSTQWVMGKQAVLAAALRIPRAKVRVLAPFVGGMFGSKVAAGAHQILAALASRALGRPVKVMLTREQVMRGVPYRSRTVQRFELGADAGGKLLGMRHTTTSQTSIADANVEPCGLTSRLLYDVPSYQNVHDLVRLDTVTSGWMRGPGEATCQLAQEIAMDELAYRVSEDPIALRVKNHAVRDPHADKPYSSKHLLRCYARGAAIFGWARRTPEPGSMKDGRILIGQGMATAAYPGYTLGATVRVDVWSEAGRPRARVATASVDVGTGMYTLMALTAADALGIPIEDVTPLVGDTTLPPCAYAGGSNLTSSVAPAIVEACAAIQRALVKTARKLDASPLRRVDASRLRFTGGRIVREDDAAAGVALSVAIDATPKAFLTAKGKTSLLSVALKRHAFHSFGAQFAEVRIDPALAAIRVSRMVGVFDCGRVMNARAARSQLEGGMIFGLGMALLEEMTFDARYGRVMNASLGDYLVPVNADVPEIAIEMLDEPDFAFNALGCRGMGEIGNTGSAAAIANAVFHATGKRVRRVPIKIEDIL